MTRRVEVEWVYDGNDVWVVQMNQLRSINNDKDSNKRIIVNGKAEKYEKVYTNDGLESLRLKVSLLEGTKIGIELIGNVGITSHFGDILRQANIPSFITSDN